MATTPHGMRFVELFAGIGLVRLALERAGWTCVYANDIDPKKRRTYAANFPGNHFHLGDVWDLDPADLPLPIDLITASFPCIDLSVAGNRSGLAGKHSSTFWALIRILESLRALGKQPKVVMVENVVGFLTSREGEDFLAAVKALNACGYTVDAILVDARHFTAQSRPRLFLFGLLDPIATKHVNRPSDAGIFSRWNTVIHSDRSVLRPRALRDIVKKHADLRWGVLDIPEPPPSHHSLSEIIEDLPEDSDRWWTPSQLEKLISQMPPSHLAGLRASTGGRKPHYGTVYRRKRTGGTQAEVRTDGLAGCLRTPRGGSSKQIVVRAWRGELRARWMTPREYARLQGAPDTFVLPENDLDAYFGFGDAICVPAVQWLGEVVLNRVLEGSGSKGSLSHPRSA